MQPRFHIGDEVKCIDNRVTSPGFTWTEGFGEVPTPLIHGYLPVSRKQKLVVISEQTYNDGSQTITVRAPNGERLRGPFLWTRFKPLKQKMLEYDPTQQGDTDDDI